MVKAAALKSFQTNCAAQQIVKVTAIAFLIKTSETKAATSGGNGANTVLEQAMDNRQSVNLIQSGKIDSTARLKVV